MPITAIDEQGNKRIAYEVPDVEFRQEWKCPQCDARMAFVDAVVRVRHFRHLVDRDCICEPDTEAHLIMKRQVFEMFTSEGYVCEYEVRIGHRMADMTVEQNGKRFAVRCSVHPVSVEDLQAIAQDFIACGYEPRWILLPGGYAHCVGQGETQSGYQYAIFDLKRVERELLGSPWLTYLIDGDFVRPDFRAKAKKGRNNWYQDEEGGKWKFKEAMARHHILWHSKKNDKIIDFLIR